MRGRRRVFAILVVIAVPVLVVVLAAIGCLVYVTRGYGDHTFDTAAAAKTLASMPGVASVTHDYEASEGILDGPGTATAEVTMERDATDEQALAVVTFVYTRFSDAVGDDYCNVAVHDGRVQMLVHTRSPDAPLEQVLAVARFALAAPRAGERTRTDITALDEPDMDAMDSQVRLRLARGSTAEDIEPRLAELQVDQQVPGGTDVWVAATDGSALGGSTGLPTAEDLQVWHALRSVSAPARGIRMRVEYGPYSLYDDVRDTEFADVKLRGKPAPIRDQLNTLKAAQTAILAEHGHSYVYTVFVNGNSKLWLRRRGH